LVKHGEEKGLTLGKDLGILSYNDTLMKKIFRNGISMITIDFAEMECSVSDFINYRQSVQRFTPTKSNCENHYRTWD